MDKTLADAVAHHRKIVDMHHAPERIDPQSLQIVLLGTLIDLHTKKAAKATKTKGKAAKKPK